MGRKHAEKDASLANMLVRDPQQRGQWNSLVSSWMEQPAKASTTGTREPAGEGTRFLQLCRRMAEDKFANDVGRSTCERSTHYTQDDQCNAAQTKDACDSVMDEKVEEAGGKPKKTTVTPRCVWLGRKRHVEGVGQTWPCVKCEG